VLPHHIQKILEEQPPTPQADIEDPPPTVFSLDGGYLDDAGEWHTEFEVRELTGRDEEALGRLTATSKFLTELLERGLIRVGPYPGRNVLDSLLAGDWESILLAIRAVTFGNEVDFVILCGSCRNRYDVTVRIDQDIPHYKIEGKDDLVFEHTGKHGNVYLVTLPTGSTQRKLLKDSSVSLAEQTSIMLADCIKKIDGRPTLGRESVVDLPLADRRGIMAKMVENKPGPRLEEVTSLCPSCGAENGVPLSIAALFR
jgi:hypothetical protein